ncbi:alpha-N-acetylglucosaminidase TIM-barrel domain-containing protein [Lentisphaerota bacterium WC36G]|nr:alpha-N-acetylglucosaminidase C-terminal domain-containing protein [Lentisphaerae bacterium WC36]
MSKTITKTVNLSLLSLAATCIMSLATNTASAHNCSSAKNLNSCNKTADMKTIFKKAAEDLIERRLPAGYSKLFVVEILEKSDNEDIFEIETINNKVILRGTDGIAVASALNWYLKYHCKVQFSAVHENLKMPKVLPILTEKVRKTTTLKYRTAYNYCTYSYTMPWWNWDQWQREIDFLAMNGVNMPLQPLGQEATWIETFKEFGLTSEQIRSNFLVGPAYFAWGFMNNIDRIGGPLPQSWVDSHIKLTRQIVERQRSLGMKMVLQGFSGRVPEDFAKKYPNVKIQQEKTWASCPGTYQMDPLDPMFEKVGKMFIKKQTELFGTDHFYAADPFHEGHPPSNAPDYLPNVGRKIFETMKAADPKAMWVMQSWSLRKPIILAAPKEKVIVFDLGGGRSFGKEPFWGRPTVYGILNNFGGRSCISGNLNSMLNVANRLTKRPANLEGIGGFDEATKINPVIWDAFYENIWRKKAVSISQWTDEYATRRYGIDSKKAKEAWNIIGKDVYRGRWATSIFAARPALTATKADPNWNIEFWYDNNKLFKSWVLLTEAGDNINKNALNKHSTTLNYDLVILGRQYLTNIAIGVFNDCVDAFYKKDIERFKKSSAKFIELLNDTNTLLGAEEQFLLGKWIKDARSWGKNQQEADLYEYNARALVSLWEADVTGRFFDYSWRSWNGLLSSYYKPRWERWFNFMIAKLQKGEEYSDKGLGRSHDRPWHFSSDWYKSEYAKEQAWTRSKFMGDIPTVATNNALELSKKFISKYYNAMAENEANSLKYGYPVNKTYEVGHRSKSPKKIKVIKNNITSGKISKYSKGTEGNNLPLYAVDGQINNNNYWAVKGDGKTKYLQLDLGKKHNIHNAQVWFYADNARYYQYKIETSADGLAWQTVVDMTKNKKPSTKKGYFTNLDAPVEARHVRLVITKNSANPSYHVVEFKLNVKQ